MTKGNTICPRPFHGGGIKIPDHLVRRRKWIGKDLLTAAWKTLINITQY
jgi:hypothetical protein